MKQLFGFFLLLLLCSFDNYQIYDLRTQKKNIKMYFISNKSNKQSVRKLKIYSDSINNKYIVLAKEKIFVGIVDSSVQLQLKKYIPEIQNVFRKYKDNRLLYSSDGTFLKVNFIVDTNGVKHQIGGFFLSKDEKKSLNKEDIKMFDKIFVAKPLSISGLKVNALLELYIEL